MLTRSEITNFEKAWASRTSGCARTCECGKEFYNPDPTWDWDTGELEAFQTNEKATALDYPVGCVELDGKEYVMDCLCWHAKAEKVIRWLYSNGDQVAKFFQLEKQTRLEEHHDTPTIEVPEPADTPPKFVKIQFIPGSRPGLVFRNLAVGDVVPLDPPACPLCNTLGWLHAGGCTYCRVAFTKVAAEPNSET